MSSSLTASERNSFLRKGGIVPANGVEREGAADGPHPSKGGAPGYPQSFKDYMLEQWLPKHRCIWFFGALMILSFPLIISAPVLSEAEVEPTTSKQHLQRRSVRFIPYPHRTLGSGASLQCQWETRPILRNNNTSLDFTQQNAYTEGICIPPTLIETLHIFSSEEAIEIVT